MLILAVIVFTKTYEAAALIKAAAESSRDNNTKQLIWIAADGWSGQLPLGNSDQYFLQGLDGEQFL